ncbi:MAG: redoxin domain-containing protein [Parvularculaceae bacterium]
MLKLTIAAMVAAAAIAFSPARAMPPVDEAAPVFSGATSAGGTISLEDFKGKRVVLEWTNDGCPFVRKHYDTGNMQATQRQARTEGAVWVTVISSAPGKQGYAGAARANDLAKANKAEPDYILLDPDGVVGRLYDAKTTPQMVLIDEEGVLRYEGAIDDKPSANHKTVDGAHNYLIAALDELKSGAPITDKQTKPYGCSVKYSN